MDQYPSKDEYLSINTRDCIHTHYHPGGTAGTGPRVAYIWGGHSPFVYYAPNSYACPLSVFSFPCPMTNKSLAVFRNAKKVTVSVLYCIFPLLTGPRSSEQENRDRIIIIFFQHFTRPPRPPTSPGDVGKGSSFSKSDYC